MLQPLNAQTENMLKNVIHLLSHEYLYSTGSELQFSKVFCSVNFASAKVPANSWIEVAGAAVAFPYTTNFSFVTWIQPNE